MTRYARPGELGLLGDRHAVVEASAGTGKTYLLEHLVVDLLLRGKASIDQILVVTFTEKATAELVQRIRAKLQELRALRPEDAAARRAEGLPDAACWLIDDRARATLAEALFHFDRACISTIHAFCQRILTDNAFSHGRLFDEETVDEQEAFHAAFVETLRARAAAPECAPLLEAWLGAGSTLDRLEEALLRAHKQLVCLHPPRAGALRPGDPDEAALREAASALARAGLCEGEPVAALGALGVRGRGLNPAAERLGFIAGALRAFAAGGPAAPLFAALDAAYKIRRDAMPYLARELDRCGAPAAVRAAVGVLDAAPSLQAAIVRALLPTVAARLEARKRERGVYDFQDMLVLVARSLERDGVREQALRAALRAQFRYALIDEFQDTDEVQWSIFRRLFFDGDGSHVLTLIGDPKQAIYAFRGADVHTYSRASDELRAAGAASVYLTANFRSSRPLIDAYNLILDQQTLSSPFFPGAIRYDRPVTCGRPERALEDEAGRPAAPVVALEITARAPKLPTWQVKEALAGRIAEEVRAIVGRLVVRDGAETRRLRERDIFVLTRTIRESQEVGEALRSAGIPFAFFKQERLFETVEASQVLDLLGAIADPDDRTARARAFITPFFGLTLPDLAACDDLPATHPLLRLLVDWRALADAGDFEQLFARIVDDSGVVARQVFQAQSERALTNILHLFEVLQEEAARTRCTVRELAQTMGAFVAGTRKPPGLGRDLQRLETDADAVQIMTIHHAKGLEADVVFVYGGFPGNRYSSVRVFHEDGTRVVHVGRVSEAEQRAFDDEQDEEERRVMYVALTRARARLYLPVYPREFLYFQQRAGSYKPVNARLGAILAGEGPDEVRALFARHEVPCPAEAQPPRPAPGAAVLARWTPPAALLAPPEVDGMFPAAVQQRAGFVVTSYSAVKRRHGGFAPPEAIDPSANEPDEPSTSPPDPGELPRGRLSGSFLHEALERVPLETLRDRPPVDAWSARPEIAALFARLARRHDRRPAHLPHALRLVHTALTAPVRLGPTTIEGLGCADQVLRELEFLYPIPERAHPAFAGAGAGFTVERGVVKGYIDLLFEHEGRVYVCDWKGDFLPGFDPARIREHCARNYEIQLQLYTLAALRLFGVGDAGAYETRFGGVLYCFVRGLRRDDPEAAVHFRKPAWDEVLSWQEVMLGDDFWRLP